MSDNHTHVSRIRFSFWKSISDVTEQGRDTLHYQGAGLVSKVRMSHQPETFAFGEEARRSIVAQWLVITVIDRNVGVFKCLRKKNTDVAILKVGPSHR